MTSSGLEGKSLLAKNSIFNFAGQILPMVVGLLTIPYIVHGLGENGYGILSIALMVLGYFGIFDLGLGRATTKFVAEHVSPDKVHKVPELVWTSLSILAVAGCVGGLVASTLVPVLVTRFLRMPSSFVGEAKTSLLILCAALPVLLVNDALRGVLEAAQRFDLVNYVKVPSSICFYSLTAVAVYFGFRVPGIILILICIRFCTACLYLALAFRVFPGLRRTYTISRTAMRSLSSFGGWVLVSNISGPLFSYLERFLIASVLSVGMLTYYSVPFDLLSKTLIFPASIAPALFPYFSFHGSEDSQAVSDVTSRSLKYLLLVMTPVTAVFVFFAGDILRLWLGAQFAAQSTVVMQVLAVVFFLNAFAYVPYASVQALGRPDLKAILDVVVLPVYAGSCWWLIHSMGIEGAAVAKAFVTVLDAAFLFGFAYKMKAFSVRDCLSGPLFKAFATSGCLIAVVFLLQCFKLALPIAFLLLTVVCACYAMAFWLFAVDSDDRVTLKALSRQLLARFS